MKLRNHELVTELVFGRPFTEVHVWLDEYYKYYRGFKHWEFRHHLKAIGEKWKLTDFEYGVAVLHILCDWLSHFRIAIVPANAEEVYKFVHLHG